MADRTTMNISLPKLDRDWIKDEMASGGFPSASEYIRHLLREERKRKLRTAIDAKLLESMRSGSAPMTKKDWEGIRRRGRARLARRKAL